MLNNVTYKARVSFRFSSTSGKKNPECFKSFHSIQILPSKHLPLERKQLQKWVPRQWRWYLIKQSLRLHFG